MKKLLLFICLLFTVTFVYSQEHLEFKGIPIDGKLSKFARELRKQGYKVDYKSKNFYSINGEFAGEDASITPYGTDKSKIVWKVMVTIKCDDWFDLKDKYFNFKELYIDKYGKPENSFEYFKDPSVVLNGKELEAIVNNEGSYSVYFIVPKGYIWMEAIGDEFQGTITPILMITYQDAVNTEIYEKEYAKKVLDDI